MTKIFNHQKTIGIVGCNPDAQDFILKANRLGFITYHLCRTEDEMSAWVGADKNFVGILEDKTIQENFLMQCDLLVYFDYSLNSTQIEEARKAVVIPQGDDLLSIAQDRVLQKAFKESLSINIAPYKTVVTQEDIKNGLRSIGYPAVLRTNYLNPDQNKQSYFIYEEKDIEEASKLLKYGTCVLESWIVTDDELSISVVKTGSGEIKTFPVLKKIYRNERLSNIQGAVGVGQDIIDEIERVAKLIADNINFIGLITIDFVISPARAIYVGNIYPFPNVFSRYFEQNKVMSAVDAHLRAIASLPISDEIYNQREYLYIPFYSDQIKIINQLIAIYPDWKFTFYSIVKNKELEKKKAVGHIIIETTDVKKTLALLAEITL